MIPILVTCEHAGNQVPVTYRDLFRDQRDLLATHRGWDPGAYEVGQALSRAVRAPYVYTKITRLLVDPNRTRDDRGRFSEITRALPASGREEILQRYYHPHWRAVEARIPPRGTVLHVASHSFTPVLRGRERPYEVGLLYDPGRPRERELVRRWREALLERWEGESVLRVRLNLPYRGWSDGMTTAFRKRYGARYLGIELECNQSLLRSREARRVRSALSASLRDAVARLEDDRS